MQVVNHFTHVQMKEFLAPLLGKTIEVHASSATKSDNRTWMGRLLSFTVFFEGGITQTNLAIEGRQKDLSLTFNSVDCSIGEYTLPNTTLV